MKKTVWRIVCVLHALVLLGAVSTFAQKAPTDNSALNNLRLDLDQIFTDSRFIGAHWGVQVYSLDRSESLYERDADRLLIPASNLKIITAAVALMRLGADYRFRTILFTDGAVVNGTLEGDLIVAGFGDPSITVKNPNEDPFSVFRIWARKLKSLGIHKISGDILGDGSSFERSNLGQGWAWDDLTEGYAAPVSALQFNENRLWLEIVPRGKPGAPPTVRLLPLPLYWIVENRLIIGTKSDTTKIEIERTGTDDSIIVRGIVSPNSPAIIRAVAVTDPVQWYLTAFKNTLEEEGIQVSACRILESNGTVTTSLMSLETHRSPPLSEIIKPLLKDSLNLYAETVTRALGMELKEKGSFAAGKEIVEETLGGMAVDTGRYSYADGSGLSRLNLVSPEALVRILRSVYCHPSFPYFYEALPVAGVEGTLENRLKGTRAENNLRAKTGSLSRVSAISGYITTIDGEMLAFSIIANNFLTPKSDADAAQDRAINKLAAFSRKKANRHK